MSTHSAFSRVSPLPALRLLLQAGLLAAGLAVGAGAALAQPVPVSQGQVVDPPGRVARIDYFDGNVSFLAAGAQDWSAAALNRPLIAGDQVWADAGARAEMHLGSSALRLGQQTQLTIATLDDDQAFLTLNQGTLQLRVRTLFPGQHLEVNTPNLAFSITQPGDYRVDVDPANGNTRVAVQAGGGVAYGEAGQTVVLGAPQQIRFGGRDLRQLSAQNGVPRDSFDQWAAARDQQEDQSASARYVSREVIGYQQLDANGEWATEAGLGPVWFPRVTVANWAPYRYGHWRYIGPWGWTWVDDAPWGFAPFHYGRWTQVGPRWGWVPGPMQPRPVYAPALVAFVGGNSGGVNWNISIGGAGQPGVGWFPLAPGEAYRPAYRASPAYVNNVNRTTVIVNNRNVTNVYRFQRPDAVTAVPAEAFARGRPTREGFAQIGQADLQRARVVQAPDVRPERRDDRRDDRRDERRDDRRDDVRRPPSFGGPPQPGITQIRPQIGIGQPPGALNDPPRPLDPRPAAQRPAPDAAREQLQRLQREDERQRGMDWNQRQQEQARAEQQRRAIAERQQQQLQNGAQRQQQEQQERVQRQQRENQQRLQPRPADDQRSQLERQPAAQLLLKDLQAQAAAQQAQQQQQAQAQQQVEHQLVALRQQQAQQQAQQAEQQRQQAQRQAAARQQQPEVPQRAQAPHAQGTAQAQPPAPAVQRPGRPAPPAGEPRRGERPGRGPDDDRRPG